MRRYELPDAVACDAELGGVLMHTSLKRSLAYRKEGATEGALVLRNCRIYDVHAGSYMHAGGVIIQAGAITQLLAPADDGLQHVVAPVVLDCGGLTLMPGALRSDTRAPRAWARVCTTAAAHSRCWPVACVDRGLRARRPVRRPCALHRDHRRPGGADLGPGVVRDRQVGRHPQRHAGQGIYYHPRCW
jgi:hypothetical protein